MISSNQFTISIQNVLLAVVVAILFVLVAGVGTQTAFAQAECHQVRASGATPFGWGSPVDVLTGTGLIMLKVFCNDSSLDVTFGTGKVYQRIHEIGYVYTDRGWQQFTYTGTQIAPGWLASPATANISLSPGEIARGGYVVGLSCDWINNAWKCGCRDFFCTREVWQMQSFHSYLAPITSFINNSFGSPSGGSTAP